MKKRYFFFLFAMLPFTLMAITGVFQKTDVSEISVSPITIHRGDTANIVISLSNPDETYNGFQMDLYLPEGISLCYEKNSGYFFELSNRLKKDRPSVVIKEQEKGRYRILVFSFNQVAIRGDSGPILTLPVVAKAKMKKGKYHGSLTDIIFNKEGNKGANFKNVDFIIKVKK